MTTHNFPTAEEIDGFATGFYGYGDFDSPLWFIGMEEGGGNSAREVTNRIHVWQRRGRAPLEDVAEYHDAIFENGFNSITKQNTWSALSRIQLAYNSDPVSGMSVRNHWQQ